MEGLWRTVLMKGVVLQQICRLIQAIQVAGNDGNWKAKKAEGE